MDPNTIPQPTNQPPVQPVANSTPPSSYGDLGPQPAAGGGASYPPPGQQIPAYQLPQQPAYQQPQQQYQSQSYPGQQPPQTQPNPNVAHIAKSNPNSTQNSLQIAEIRDGVVIMNDGSFRSVIMVKSINFDLMSPQERESVEFSYQGFLNSLYYPVQIFIRSQKVDLRPYIERLDKIRSEHDNMLLALLMDDYIGFIGDLSQQTNIMDKRFYVIVPYFPVADITNITAQSKSFFSGLKGLFDNKQQHVTINEADLNKAKDELRNRVQATLNGLQQSGIPGLPLDTQELIELYYDTYNPDTATRQPLKNFGNMSANVIEKGEGVAYQPNLDKELPV